MNFIYYFENVYITVKLGFHITYIYILEKLG